MQAHSPQSHQNRDPTSPFIVQLQINDEAPEISFSPEMVYRITIILLCHPWLKKDDFLKGDDGDDCSGRCWMANIFVTDLSQKFH